MQPRAAVDTTLLGVPPPRAPQHSNIPLAAPVLWPLTSCLFVTPEHGNYCWQSLVSLVRQAMSWPLEIICFHYFFSCSKTFFSFFFASYRTDSWQLVQTHCLPSSSNSIGCSPFQFHEATIYNSVNSSMWRRITIQLPDHVSSR